MKSVSVVLAVYNEGKYLKPCLESLSQQVGIDVELIVIDDGSWRPIRNIKPNILENKLFKLLRIEHSGTAVARNFGVKKAQGDIVVFVDGDMTFEPDFLKKLVAPIQQKKTLGTFSTEEFVANWDNRWARCWNYENGLKTNRRVNPARQDMVKDFRAILKTEFEKVGGFDDIGYTDTWTLSEKLDYKPSPTQAKYYHYNPASLGEVFWQAMWIGARKRKWGLIGKIVALARASLPVSVIYGLIGSMKYQEFFFLQFKLIYDLGVFGGILSSLTAARSK